MNAFIYLVFIFTISSICKAGEYCIPPNFTTGPYTAITNVKINNINNPSSESDGYSDYTTSLSTVNLIAGSSDSIYFEFYYDPSMLSFFQGNINVRVWIDLNHDFDFDDPGETIISKVVSCKKSTDSNPYITLATTLSLPSSAMTGNTRMRIYEDMQEVDGHDKPTPCGYLNSTNTIGQHGECEDYPVNISKADNVEIEQLLNISFYPNPTSDFLNINYKGNMNQNYSISIQSIVGEELLNSKLENDKKAIIDISMLKAGVYLIKIQNGLYSKIQKIIKY